MKYVAFNELIQLCVHAVPPPFVEALVTANLPEMCQMLAAAVITLYHPNNPHQYFPDLFPRSSGQLKLIWPKNAIERALTYEKNA